MTRGGSLARCVLLALCVHVVAPAPAVAQPPPAPPVPPPAPDKPEPRPRPVAMCERCERAHTNLAGLEAPHGERLRAAIPSLVRLDQLGIHRQSLTPQQADELDVLLDADAKASLRLYRDLYGDPGMRDLAGLLCGVDASPCVDSTYIGLGCISSDACEVDRREAYDPRPPTRGCDPSAHTYKGKKGGYGPEVATGWRDSALPNDHRAWGFGFEFRRRLNKRFGGVLRFDWQTGRDAGIDTDGDGRDDDGTGRVSRVSALAGPSVLLMKAWSNGIWRYVELDLLGGYTAMTSPSNENGVVAGADLSFQIAITRWGLRALQGFGEARDARSVLFHWGLVFGAVPDDYTVVGGCDFVRNPDTTSGFALGFDLALSGYELGTGIGYMPPMPAIETAYFVHPNFQAIARGDLTVFTNGDAARVLHHSLLAGGRIDLSAGSGRSRSGPFLTLLAGYGWAAVTKPSSAGSGPLIDASLGWLYQEDDAGVWARLHGRFGMTPDNEDLRALFLSIGMEVRLDRRRWRAKTHD